VSIEIRDPWRGDVLANKVQKYIYISTLHVHVVADAGQVGGGRRAAEWHVFMSRL
jgi:hypothetical protein